MPLDNPLSVIIGERLFKHCNPPNRSLRTVTIFVDRLGQAVRRTKRGEDYRVAAWFSDLDNFKSVNDSSGHETGDHATYQRQSSVKAVPEAVPRRISVLWSLAAACTTRMATWQMCPYSQLANMIAKENAEGGEVGTRRGNEAELARAANRPVRDLPATLNLVPRATGAAAAIVGCLVLAGWILDADVLKRIIPGLVAMNPATAMAFILLGISMWLLRSGEVSRGARRVSRGLAVMVALVGLTKIVQIVFGWEFGVDQLLFPEKLELEAKVVGIPNRMAPNTALNFLLVGCSLLLIDWRTRSGRWPAQYFVAVGMVATLLAVIGYGYGVQAFLRRYLLHPDGAAHGAHVPRALRRHPLGAPRARADVRRTQRQHGWGHGTPPVASGSPHSRLHRLGQIGGPASGTLRNRAWGGAARRCGGRLFCRDDLAKCPAATPFRQRAQARRTGTQASQGVGRGGQHGQERVSGEHESRDTYPHERRHRHDGATDGHRPRAEQREYAETVRSSGENLLTIINDILDFSKDRGRASSTSKRWTSTS
jgi:hypothetical protein